MLFSSYHLSELALIGSLALLLNLMFGGPGTLYAPVAFLHPLRLWEGLLRVSAEKLNRFRRSEGTRRMRGLLMMLLVIFGAALLGSWLAKLFLLPGGEYIEIVLLALLLSSRPLFDVSIQVSRLLKHPKEGWVTSQILTERLMRRQMKDYDVPTVLRGTIEAMMLGLSESVVAPLLYYLVAGWPGVLVVVAVTAADRMIGYRNSQYADFGKAAAVLHTLLQWIPARITGLLLCVASAFAPGCSPLAALRVMLLQAGKTISNNSGWVIGATAGALKITLGGPRAMLGSFIADQWIGEGKARLDERSLKAAQALFLVTHLLLVMGFLIAAAA